MDTPLDFLELLRRDHEAKDLDYKGPMLWDEADKGACCEIVKDILAMANTQGGFIVIGVEETDTGFVRVGVTNEQAASWETTRLNQFVARYAEPPVNSALTKQESAGKTYVVIGVPEFPDVPHICKKDYPDVLTTPILYIRTDDNNSAPISRVSDMNSLIGTAVRKRGDAIVDTVRHVLSVGLTEPEPSVAKQFESQIEDALSRFAEQSKFAGKFDGWREMVAFPDTFQPDRAEPESIYAALQHAEESFTGWPFVSLRPSENVYRIEDGYESKTDFSDFLHNQREYFWQVRDTGLFFHRELMPEETWTHPRWLAEVGVPDSTPIMAYKWTLQYVTLGIRCASRLYEALQIEDDPIIIRFRLTATEGRTIVPASPIPPLIVDWICHIPEVKVERSQPLSVWRASTAQLAAEMTAEILEMFNWKDPNIDHLREGATKLLQRR